MGRPILVNRSEGLRWPGLEARERVGVLPEASQHDGHGRAPVANVAVNRFSGGLVVGYNIIYNMGLDIILYNKASRKL